MRQCEPCRPAAACTSTLRERLDDVPLLVDALLDRVSSQIGVKRPDIRAEALKKLNEYSHPGTSASCRTSSSAP